MAQFNQKKFFGNHVIMNRTAKKIFQIKQEILWMYSQQLTSTTCVGFICVFSLLRNKKSCAEQEYLFRCFSRFYSYDIYIYTCISTRRNQKEIFRILARNFLHLLAGLLEQKSAFTPPKFRLELHKQLKVSTYFAY